MSIVKRFPKRQSILPDLDADSSERLAISQSDLENWDNPEHTKAVPIVERFRYEYAETVRAYNELRDYAIDIEAARAAEYELEETYIQCIRQPQPLGVSAELVVAGFSSLCGLSIAVLSYFEVRDIYKKFDFTQLGAPVSLPLYIYAASLATNACLYLRGYFFKFVAPNTDCREDHLRCVQTSIRAWVKYTTIWKTEEELEKKVILYQEGFASYLVDPYLTTNAGIEYSRERNISILIIFFWGYFMLGRMTYLAVLWLATDSENDADRVTIACGAVGMVLILGCLHGTLLLRAERFGRGLRMSALVQQIRQNCFSDDMEKRETRKERLTWWIENLVRGGSYNNKEKLDDNQEQAIQRLMEELEMCAKIQLEYANICHCKLCIDSDRWMIEQPTWGFQRLS